MIFLQSRHSAAAGASCLAVYVFADITYFISLDGSVARHQVSCESNSVFLGAWGGQITATKVGGW